MTTDLYPPNPAAVPAAVTQPSAAFKKEVTWVLFSIIIFFAVYLLLIAMAIALTIGCAWAGFWIIATYPRFITLMLGLGLMGLGIMVFAFLVKFIFAVNRYDRSGMQEISEAGQPQLFAFIRQISRDTQTQFPKHIYLSPEVNACVFYDSSFWSMFFPVKKNLQVGLALVNSLNLSEFKAVLAHEFGHFSQRSMKLGSFVYNVNQVIFNMLNKNEGYGNALQQWGSVSGYFALFANITVGIVSTIQLILRVMYGFINKNYMRLSREMEFHADAVAASVSGANNCISALRRVELSSSCYQATLSNYNDLFRDKKIAGNVYADHRSVMAYVAGEHRLPTENGLPVITREVLDELLSSRVNFKDQWASHPTTEERTRQLNALQVEVPPVNEPAWVLFKDREALQLQMTSGLYSELPTSECTKIDPADFDIFYRAQHDRYKLPGVYNDYFGARMPDEINPDGCDENRTPATLEDILTPSAQGLPAAIKKNNNDLALLNMIKEGKAATRSFDFDGQKYPAAKVTTVIALLENEMAEQQKLLQTTDQQVFCLFARQAREKGGETQWKAWCEIFTTQSKSATAYGEQIGMIMEQLQKIFSGRQFSTSDAQNVVNLMRGKEKKFKEQLRAYYDDGTLDEAPELKILCEKYLSATYVYFNGNNFFDYELRELHRVMGDTFEQVTLHRFLHFKKMLEYQAGLSA